VGALLVVGGLGLLALPGLFAPLGRRLPPAEWARLCRLAVVAGAVIVEVACVLYALPTVLRSAGVPALARMCQRAIGLFLPGGAPAAWTAAAAAVTIAGLATLGSTRARRGCRSVRVEPWLGEHRRYGQHDLVVLPTNRPVAVSVTGTPGQILVSQGLIDALSVEQFDVVIRHEAAHLELDHQRTLRLAAALDYGFAFFGPLRRSTAALRVALERWADEVAAGDTPGERGLLRSALLGVTAVAVGAELAAFSATETILERLRALERPRPNPTPALRVLLYAPGVALAAIVVVALAAWGGEARMLVAMAGRCPL
jgi:Zn-dependent protease with chaperone function